MLTVVLSAFSSADTLWKHEAGASNKLHSTLDRPVYILDRTHAVYAARAWPWKLAKNFLCFPASSYVDSAWLHSADARCALNG